MRTRRRQSLAFASAMLIVSVWATALVTVLLAQQLLEALTFLYATVMSSFVLFFMLKTRKDTAQLSSLNGASRLAPLKGRMNKLQSKA